MLTMKLCKMCMYWWFGSNFEYFLLIYSITVTVDDVVCLGVDCGDGSNQERSSILACDKMTGKEG